MARPCPLPSADVSPAPCRLCPVHLQPQCEQCWLARRGVAHSCVRGHAGHPAAVAGAAASSWVLQAWLAPPELPLELPAMQAPLRGAATGGSGPPPAAGWPLAQPTGTPRPSAKYSALGGEYSPSPSTGSSGPQQGGREATGSGGEPQWLGTHGAGRVATPPPPLPPVLAPPVAAPPSAAEPGEARPMSDVFSVISRTLTASRVPPPHCAARERGREEGQVA